MYICVWTSAEIVNVINETAFKYIVSKSEEYSLLFSAACLIIFVTHRVVYSLTPMVVGYKTESDYISTE